VLSLREKELERSRDRLEESLAGHIDEAFKSSRELQIQKVTCAGIQSVLQSTLDSLRAELLAHKLALADEREKRADTEELYRQLLEDQMKRVDTTSELDSSQITVVLERCRRAEACLSHERMAHTSHVEQLEGRLRDCCERLEEQKLEHNRAKELLELERSRFAAVTESLHIARRELQQSQEEATALHETLTGCRDSLRAVLATSSDQLEHAVELRGGWAFMASCEAHQSLLLASSALLPNATEVILSSAQSVSTSHVLSCSTEQGVAIGLSVESAQTIVNQRHITSEVLSVGKRRRKHK